MYTIMYTTMYTIIVFRKSTYLKQMGTDNTEKNQIKLLLAHKRTKSFTS